LGGVSFTNLIPGKTYKATIMNYCLYCGQSEPWPLYNGMGSGFQDVILFSTPYPCTGTPPAGNNQSSAINADGTYFSHSTHIDSCYNNSVWYQVITDPCTDSININLTQEGFSYNAWPYTADIRFDILDNQLNPVSIDNYSYYRESLNNGTISSGDTLYVVVSSHHYGCSGGFGCGIDDAITGANYTISFEQIYRGIYGYINNDLNQNCLKDNNETGLANRLLYVQPGNIILSSNTSGRWCLDSLPTGNYTITADTSDEWSASCSPSSSFTVVHPDSMLQVADIELYTNNPCTAPDISIHAPVLRSGFSNQLVYVQVCNQNTATGIINSAWVIVELDPLLFVDTASMPYIDLGNNQYRVDIGNIYPGQCQNFTLSCSLSTAATLTSTLCMEANLYPVDSCALDDTPNPYSDSTISPCTLPWDGSSLMVEGSCVNDSIRFVIYNTGAAVGGDMDCFAPVRIYIDGQFYLLDSIQLAGGDSIVFMFDGDGRTWRLEAGQHPLHPGNSHPNASVENCGSGTWTPNLINTMPLDDADPVNDIYCRIVTGSYDPNDKTGYPLGVGTTHDILPGQNIEYVIRFQNTGTDTAFTVVIRDTLSTDLDIFSVVSGASSHDYTFRMYGPRVLEWTFHNIMLPDSNVNEPASNGFVKFKVDQAANLPLGTLIENSASIYFDFNAPIFTNTYFHTINENYLILEMDKITSEQMQVKVYPNPTTGLVHIERGNTEQISILLFDNLGRVLLSRDSEQSLTQLNLSDLLPGIYYLSVNDGKRQSSFKVVKR
jgi:uncharacterized repeat protein (TIGR01451 family)